LSAVPPRPRPPADPAPSPPIAHTIDPLEAALLQSAAAAASRLTVAPKPAQQEPALAESPELSNGRTEELDTWWLPAPVRDWCDAVSAAMACPKTLPVAAALCAAATVLQGRVSVTWKPGVTEPLCLYWFVFSGTGTRKTAILSRARRAIDLFQAQMAEQCAKDTKVVTNKRRRLEAQLGRLRRQKAAGPHTSAHQEWMGQIRELEHDLDELVPPKAVEWTQSNVNPSLLPRFMQHNHEAEGIARLAVLIDEGSFLKNLMGRHQGGQPILEEVLGAVNGEPMLFVRSSRVADDPVKVRLPHSYLTICALLQPHLLDVLKSPELSDVGFVGRCLVDVLDDSPIKPGWECPPIPDHVQAAYDRWLRALIDEELPETVDLTLDAATRRSVRALYESVEADGTGWSQRITGLICRIAAIVDIGKLVADRIAQGRSCKTVEQDGKHQKLGTTQIPKHVHVVTDDGYDWLDDENMPAPESAIINTEESGGSKTGDDWGRLSPVGGGSSAREIDHLTTLIYTNRIRMVRTLDRPAQSLATLASRALCTIHGRPQSPGPQSVRDVHKAFTPKGRPSADRLYAALELLVESGCIEWDPASLRRVRGETHYTKFIVLVRPGHLKAVP